MKPGSSISHYRIVEELGRGGMGVVYKASDTKLDRTVALKVLPPNALSSEDDRARFYREARAAAALHHPHIATVFEIDEHDGQPFIAMEFIDGQSLDDKIAERPLPLETAVAIASQIAQGLKAAHTKNIVHRDVKSANVMLTGDGTAKILDFGLAKTAASTKLTQYGSTLGTVAYMSPEQARSNEVDHRSDLWSLGVVLYEMIAGKLPFLGDFEQAVVYSILNEEPKPLTAVRTGVPMGLEWIVTKLLAKNADDRYQSAADLLVDLRTVDLKDAGLSRIRSSGTLAELQSAQPGASSPAEANRSVAVGRLAAPALAFLLGLALMGTVWLLWPESVVDTETSVKQLDLTLPGLLASPGADISPDGGTFVYASAEASGDNVFVRDLATGDTRLIRGSDGTFTVSVSPDGEWVLLTKNQSIERASLYQGSPILVTTTREGGPRAAWGPGSWIIFEESSSIWKLNLDSGEKMALAVSDSLAGESDFDWPRLLPDGKTVVGTIEYDNAPSAIGFWDFETGERRGQILIDGYRPQYVDSGHILAVLGPQGGNLVAIPFDLTELKVNGPPRPVAADVDPRMTTVSLGGTLITAPRQNSNLVTSRASSLALVTFPSSVTPLAFEPAIYRSIELSPDGSRVVASLLNPDDSPSGSIDGASEDVWVLDLDRGTRLRLTSGGTGSDPTWWPGADSIAYIDRRRLSTMGAIAKVRAADGSGAARELFSIKSWMADIAISPSGSHAAYVVGGRLVASTKLFLRDLATGQTTVLSDDDAARYRHPAFSPDGQYLAYQKDDRYWVTETSGGGVPHYAGLAGLPRWSADGRSIYATDGFWLARRDVSFEPFTISRTSDGVASGFGQNYLFDVFEDGRTALVTVLDAPATGAEQAGGIRDTSMTVSVTVNWLETLRSSETSR